MGISTDAVLFYGYCWKEECMIVRDGDSYTDWESIVLKKRGVNNPWDKMPDYADLPYTQKRFYEDAWIKENREALDAWREEKKKVQEEFKCDIGRHCSGEYSIPYVYISSVVANRGYPHDVTGMDMSVRPEWDALLNRFMDELGIERPHEAPRWWLVSFWG